MKRWLKILLIILAALVVLAVAGFFLLSGSNQVTVSSLAIDAATVTRGNIDVLVNGTGMMEVEINEDVYSRVNGKVAEVLVSDGDTVEQGELLVRLENDDLDTQLKKLTDDLYLKELELSTGAIRDASTTVRAPVSGRVKSLHMEKEDDLQALQAQWGSLMVLSTDGRMRIDLPAGEANGSALAQDVKVRIRDKVEDGTLLREADGTRYVLIQNDSYEVGDPAQITDTNGSAIGQGELKINRPYPITGVSGQVRTVDVKENDKVSVGDRLYSLESDAVSLELERQILARDQLIRDLAEVRDQIADLEIRSPIDGVVCNIGVTTGASVANGAQVANVIDPNKGKIRLSIDELDIAMVRSGQPATIKIDALPGMTFQCTVDRILPLGTRVNDITNYDVILYLEAEDAMLPLMSLSGDITVASAQDALLVPVSALQIVGNDRYVMLMPTDADLAGYNGASGSQGGGMMSRFTRQNDSAILQSIAPQLMRRVEVGLISGEYAQILSGLSEGEQIVLPRSGSNLILDMMRMGR